LGMDYICGEDREQAAMLPDSIEDYMDNNNSAKACSHNVKV